MDTLTPSPKPPTPISNSDRREHLVTVLNDFKGDVQRASAALAAVQRSRQAPAAPHPNYGPVLIQLDHVNRQYKLGRGQIAAVQDISLTICEREFVAITGPSGSGKSTLLNLLGGLDRPDTGTITIDGHNLSRLSDPHLAAFRNRTVGFVFQFFYLQPFLNVRTNLAVPGMFAHLPRAERAQRITELAAAVGLTDRLEHLPGELSGGQMQRAAIARALLNRPKIILADEPTGNLDRTNAHAILELFAQVRATYGTTVIIVTHDAEAASLADRIITLRDGKVTA